MGMLLRAAGCGSELVKVMQRPFAAHLFLEKPISCSCCRSSSLTLGSTCWAAANFNACVRACEWAQIAPSYAINCRQLLRSRSWG